MNSAMQKQEKIQEQMDDFYRELQKKFDILIRNSLFSSLSLF